MPILLDRARRGGYAVGYFESWDLASLEAVIDAAEAERSSVIVGFGGMMVDGAWLEARGVRMLGGAARAAAELASVPTAVMFNEAQTVAQAEAALTAGYNCLLLSTDSLPAAEALRVTADLTARAHAAGLAVEAELGHLPDWTSGRETGGELTDPVEAAAFVAATNIDCLAVSIGNVHVKADGWAAIDSQRLESLYDAVGIPFAIHGGTSFPPSAIPHAVEHGVAKMNVGTILKRVYLDALRASVGSLPPDLDVHEALGSRKPRDITSAARAALTAKVRELMRAYGSSGKAAGCTEGGVS
jgi:fructose/tagatose bisphosphate aldolase